MNFYVKKFLNLMLLITIAYHVNQFQQYFSSFIEICWQITMCEFKVYKYSDFKYVYIVKWLPQ